MLRAIAGRKFLINAVERTVPVTLCTPSDITIQANRQRCQAGRYKVTLKRTRPLTYEESQKPHLIGVRKAWNSWNTSNLVGGQMPSEIAVQDHFIRMFIYGTWHRLFQSEVIIKRRANMIIVCGIVHRALRGTKCYWLIGYTEEMLSLLLKAPVKMEITTLSEKNALIYKHI